MTLPPSAWYPDPDPQFPGYIRYWDGHQWTHHRQRASSPASPSPTERPKVTALNAKRIARDLESENARLHHLLGESGGDVVELQRLAAEAREEISAAATELSNLQNEISQARSQLVDIQTTAKLQDLGYFNYQAAAESSASLSAELSHTKQAIKQALANDRAAQTVTNFTFDGSTSKGRKFVQDMKKLLLRAYNAEAENCIMSVKAGNLQAAVGRLNTAVNRIERLGSMIQMSISPDFHRLRIAELELSSRHLSAIRLEKEMERDQREQLREQRKAEQEFNRERERLNKERGHILNVIERLRSNGDAEGVQRMNTQLADVEKAIQDTDYRAANMRAGYVYIISNTGAFGPGVVKIGMTRRLDPMDRVRELGDASVPFRFDVHALFFADDAVAVEGMLHRHFAERRLNLVNLRREFFRATPQEVLKALRDAAIEVVEYKVGADAEEWATSEQLRPRGLSQQ